MCPLYMTNAGDVNDFNAYDKVTQLNGRLDVSATVRSETADPVIYGTRHSLDPLSLIASAQGWALVHPTSAVEGLGICRI